MADFSGDLFSVFQPDSSTSAALKRDKAGSKRKGDEVEVSDAKKLPQLSSLNTEVSIDAAEDSRTQETAVVDLEDQEQKVPPDSDPATLQVTDSKAIFSEPATVIHLDDVEGCTHEVAVPPGYVYTPLQPYSGKPVKEYKFVLDSFQREAIKCLNNNQSVLVSAHTSAGKTVVAEYAIAMSLRDTQRVIYTTPIKALSNQKYRELYEEFKDVGLMTGDVTINPSASCLVMTTEILRNMLYRGSEVMREVAWLVFDEIHYMRDTERGVVWEETIILLPDKVNYVFLSATIPNANQFAQWICQLHHQPCHVVYTDRRPVPLQHYIFPANADGVYLVLDEKGNFREDNFQKSMLLLQDEGTPAERRGRKGGIKGVSSCFKLVKMIMERNMQPVIIFSFSRHNCEAFALELSKLDFNSAEEKSLVKEVFTNAIDCLSEDDKKLPQVEHVLPLLLKGIGIHHSGLLPILKETIEILFSEGLIKALFATETFALGLNMPARTVLFSGARKFDGKDFRWITSGEYIQMSGRAGRRGIDEKGIVMLMVDEKMDTPTAKAILLGQPDPLNSAFHLTYNMVLNLLRVEEINPEFVLERSFYQFQNNLTIPGLERKVREMEQRRDAIVIESEESAMSYYRLRQQIGKLAKEMHRFMVKPKYLLPFLQPGRLVQVESPEDDYGWGCVVNFQKKANQKGAKETVYVAEVLLKCSTASSQQPKGVPPRPPQPGDRGEMQVVPVLLNFVKKISSVRIYIPADLRPADNRHSVSQSVQEVQRRFPDGLPQLDPVQDMNIRDDDFKSIIRKIDALEQRLFAHALHEKAQSERLYGLCERKIELVAEIKEAKKELKKAQTIMQMDELKCRKRVLRRLGYASSTDVIDVKGRVACEISSGDELLLTELLFNGVFNDLTAEQSVALLSCFVFQEKADTMPKLKEHLSGPLKQMQDSARRIAQVVSEAKLPIEEDVYVSSFKPHLMDVVHAWASGAPFSQLCKMTDAFEGSIIRCIRRLEELLRQMCQAAKAIGNAELEKKFEEGSTKIKRDIIFAASLYL